MGRKATSPTSEISFETAAKGLVEALPLGNGILGVMSYGRAGGETLTVNRHDAWSGNKNSPYQEIPAFKVDGYLERVRDLIDANEIHQAEELLKQAQSSHSQAFLPYVDFDISTAGEPFGRSDESLQRTLDFENAVSLNHYVYETVHLSHATYVPRDAQKDRSSKILHIVENPGAHPVLVTLAVRTLLRGFAHPDQGYVIELPSDVAPTHEANPQHVRYHGASPRVGCLGIAAALVPLSSASHTGTNLVGTDQSYAAHSSTEQGFTEHQTQRALPTPSDSSTNGQHNVAETGDAELAPELHETYQLPAGHCLVIVIESPDIEQLNGISGSLDARQAQIARAVRDCVATAQQEAAKAALEAAANIPVHLNNHTRAHRELTNTMSLELPDQRVTKQFNFGRYLLASAHAPHALPLNLQGLWCHDIPAPWSSNYTLNINTPMNYWGVEAAGLPGLHESLIEWLEMVAKGPGKFAAEKLYQLPGIVLHHNADAWGHSLPAGAGAGDASWAYWPLGAVWMLRQAWDHYEYGQDPSVLERIWPLIEQVGLFAEAWIVLDGDTAKTYPSVSPENRYYHRGHPASVSSSVTMDVALLQDFARYANTAHDALFGADARPPLWLASLTGKAAALPGYQVGSKGQLQEWITDHAEVEPQHRHLSHLVGVYPLGTTSDPEVRAAARRSLELRGDDSTGWSLAWRIGLWARLGEPHKMLDAIERSLRPAYGPHGQDDDSLGSHENRGGIYPNLLSAHPPFQIDGNYGFIAGILEALCRAEDNRITLFPALPETWPTGKVRGLRLRGALTVNLEWSNHWDCTVQVRDTRATGGQRTVMFEAASDQRVELKIRPAEMHRITLKRGEKPMVTRVS